MTARRASTLVLVLCAIAVPPARAATSAEPDYAEWNRILAAYYDPAHGMDYGGLAKREKPALERLRQSLAKANVAALDRRAQLAYWLDLYNVNVVSRVVEGYPVESIRDLSTDPIVRLNVFKKETVPFAGAAISLDTIENEKVREGFHDPRVHFALNCAAKSCPVLRTEAYVGARLDAQLDDQVRRYASGRGLRVERHGSEVTLHVTKIFDWFEKDFASWGGGVVPFLRRYLPAEKARLVPAGAEVDLEYDDYDWSLNDWRR